MCTTTRASLRKKRFEDFASRRSSLCSAAASLAGAQGGGRASSRQTPRPPGQARWGLSNHPHEVRDNSRIPMSENRNEPSCARTGCSHEAGHVLVILGFAFWICFGCRISRFGLGCSFAALKSSAQWAAKTCVPGSRPPQQTFARRATLCRQILNPEPFFPNPSSLRKKIRHKPNRQEAPFCHL